MLRGAAQKNQRSVEKETVHLEGAVPAQQDQEGVRKSAQVPKFELVRNPSPYVCRPLQDVHLQSAQVYSRQKEVRQAKGIQVDGAVRGGTACKTKTKIEALPAAGANEVQGFGVFLAPKRAGGGPEPV